MGAFSRLCAAACVALLAATSAPMAVNAAERADHPGNLIAFSRVDTATESAALFRARPDGSHRRRLTPGPAFFPSWSPDRTHLAFDFTDEDGNQQIGMVHRSGSHFRQLTDLVGISEVARFSPDGTTLVFDRSPVLPDGPRFFTSLWVMDTDGSNARPLFKPDPDKFDVEPEYSPNGRRIVFARLHEASGAQKTAIFTVRADGTRERRITRFKRGLEHPRWSPDGHRIVFDIERPDPTDPASGIFQVRANGTHLRPVLRADERMFGFKPAFSPNGERILFGCFIVAQEQDDLCVMRADGSRVRNITRTPRIFENYTTWR